MQNSKVTSSFKPQGAVKNIWYTAFEYDLLTFVLNGTWFDFLWPCSGSVFYNSDLFPQEAAVFLHTVIPTYSHQKIFLTHIAHIC